MKDADQVVVKKVLDSITDATIMYDTLHEPLIQLWGKGNSLFDALFKPVIAARVKRDDYQVKYIKKLITDAGLASADVIELLKLERKNRGWLLKTVLNNDTMHFLYSIFAAIGGGNIATMDFPMPVPDETPDDAV